MPIIVGPSRRGTDQLYGLFVYSNRCIRLGVFDSVLFYLGPVRYD